MTDEYVHHRIEHIVLPDNRELFQLLELPDELQKNTLGVFTEHPFELFEAEHICKNLIKTQELTKKQPNYRGSKLPGYVLIIVDDNGITPHWYCSGCVDYFIGSTGVHPENATSVDIGIAVMKKHQEYISGNEDHIHE